MKNISLTTVAVFIISLTTFAQSVHELTDLKNIVFARNLKDWEMKPVDSLMFDVYYPTGARSDRTYPVCFVFHGEVL